MSITANEYLEMYQDDTRFQLCQRLVERDEVAMHGRAEIERLTRERDEAMNANMAKIAPFLPPLATGSTVAADTPAPMSYREVVACAELIVRAISDETIKAAQLHTEARRVMAKNENEFGAVYCALCAPRDRVAMLKNQGKGQFDSGSLGEVVVRRESGSTPLLGTRGEPKASDGTSVKASAESDVGATNTQNAQGSSREETIARMKALRQAYIDGGGKLYTLDEINERHEREQSEGGDHIETLRRGLVTTEPDPALREEHNLHGCFSDIPGAKMCMVCGGDLFREEKR